MSHLVTVNTNVRFSVRTSKGSLNLDYFPNPDCFEFDDPLALCTVRGCDLAPLRDLLLEAHVHRCKVHPELNHDAPEVQP